jgi:predicted PurR-regulated permease PerM
MTDERPKLEQYLSWLVLAILLACCLLVLRPFISAMLWAVVLTSSSWPLYCRLTGWLGGRRNLAAAGMALAMVMIILLPFVVIGTTLGSNVTEWTAAVKSWIASGPQAPPDWLAGVPLVGPKLVAQWQSLAADTSRIFSEAARFIEPLTAWLLQGGLALGGGLIELALSILLAFFLFRDGAAMAERISLVVVRIAGERGRQLLSVAGDTVRGVVYGILGTALAQAVLAGIGFRIAGVPGSGMLALLTFFLSVVPIGPPLIWLPASLWLFHEGSSGMGIFMLIWGVGVSSVDNFVKPWLISQGSDLPFILIFFGVLGGVMAFGFIGAFIGPTLLAVCYRLVKEWIATSPVAGNPTDPDNREI